MAIVPSADSYERMRVNRAFAEKLADRGDVVYGLSTGVGVRKKTAVDRKHMVQFQERMVLEHATGQGKAMDPVVVRASAVCLLNSICAGRTNIRPAIARRLSERLCDAESRPLRPVPKYGTTGMGDVTPLAHLSRDLVYLATDATHPEMDLAAGEALPLIAQSSVATAQAAIALHEAIALLKQMNVLAALDVEAYAANPAPYCVRAEALRPYAGHKLALGTLQACLKGGELYSTPNEKQRHLQSPLTFRTVAGVLGAAYDALAFCEQQVGIELNAHQQNPMSLMEDDKMITSGHFDMQAIAQAMDFARLALAPCLTTQVERSVKMLQARDTGLPDGLAHPDDHGAMGHGLSEILWPLQAMGTEARLLAVQMVSAEVGSGGMAEGVEDRLTMAGLAAERLRKFVDLAHRCLAISTTISCQAIDLRGCRLSDGLARVHGRVREHVAVMGAGDPPPASLETLVDALVGGKLLCVREGKC